MNPTPLILILATALLVSGCASNEPSPAMREWARQQVAEKQRAEAEAKHAQEIARLKAENDRIKAQAEADRQKAEAADLARKEAEINARLEKNKEQITTEFTEAFYPLRHDLMTAAKFTGTLIAYQVDGVMVKNHILYVSHHMVWKNPEGTGGYGRYFLGYDTRTDQWVTGDASEVTHLSREHIAGVMNAASNNPPPAEAKPSVWTPTNETVNTGYKAAIGVGAGVLTAIIQNMLSAE